jgi:hypothetical protein
MLDELASSTAAATALFVSPTPNDNPFLLLDLPPEFLLAPQKLLVPNFDTWMVPCLDPLVLNPPQNAFGEHMEDLADIVAGER